MEGRTGNAIRNQFQLLTRHQIKKNQKKIVIDKNSDVMNATKPISQLDTLFDMFAFDDAACFFNQDTLFSMN